MAKNYEELKLSDDFMFGKVMEDGTLCREVLECLLGKPVGELTEMQPQREYRYAVDGKPIRLDIYTGDGETVYDAEMQNLNHKKPEDYDLPRRSRFYQAAMDTDHLKKNQSYRSLPETNILFICTFDPFRKGLPRYTFRNKCEEMPELALQDHAVKYFFNCTCQSEGVPDGIQALYRYIMTGEPLDELTGKLHKAVEAGRRNEKWRSEYMKELLHDDDMREEGRAEGREEERINTERERARAEREKANAEHEKARADEQEARANTQEARADALEARVRELEGIIRGKG